MNERFRKEPQEFETRIAKVESGFDQLKQKVKHFLSKTMGVEEELTNKVESNEIEEFARDVALIGLSWVVLEILRSRIEDK